MSKQDELIDIIREIISSVVILIGLICGLWITYNNGPVMIFSLKKIGFLPFFSMSWFVIIVYLIMMLIVEARKP